MRLQSLIERYIAYRQALGESFKTNASILRAFGRAIGVRATIAAVGARQVRAFLDGKGPITRAWFGRHNALLGFYHYAITRGYVAVSPLPVSAPEEVEEAPKAKGALSSESRSRNGRSGVYRITVIEPGATWMRCTPLCSSISSAGVMQGSSVASRSRRSVPESSARSASRSG